MILNIEIDAQFSKAGGGTCRFFLMAWQVENVREDKLRSGTLHPTKKERSEDRTHKTKLRWS